MHAVPAPRLSDPLAVPLWRRRTTLAIVVLLHLLVLVLLFRPGAPLAPPPVVDREPKTFEVRQYADDEIAPKPAPRGVVAKAQRTAGGATSKTPAPPVEPVKPPPPRPVDTPLDLIEVSRDTFAAADIGAMPRRSGPPAPGGGSGSGSGSGSGDDKGAGDGAGEGPGGEKLYYAEWYRRPTHAEMATYMPPGRAQAGWGEVACRTIPDNRVDQCQELGDSAPGLGFSRALRQAAWQFRVRPPRVGGRPLVGAWVRIHFDFTVLER